MTTSDNQLYTKCLIIGSGPAGYTAALYTGRANLAPVLIEGMQPGGQLTITTDIENFPGYPEGTTGSGLMDDMRRQALRFGADMRQGTVSSIDFSSRPFKATTEDGLVVNAETIILATGASARFLGLEDEKKFMGLGVSACATCDGFFYRGKKVAVVGGGDTACEEALYLSNLASEVYLIVRKNYLRASKVMQQRVFSTVVPYLAVHSSGPPPLIVRSPEPLSKRFWPRREAKNSLPAERQQ